MAGMTNISDFLQLYSSYMGKCTSGYPRLKCENCLLFDAKMKRAKRVQSRTTILAPPSASEHHVENLVHQSWHFLEVFAENGWQELGQKRINFQEKVR